MQRDTLNVIEIEKSDGQAVTNSGTHGLKGYQARFIFIDSASEMG